MVRLKPCCSAETIYNIEIPAVVMGGTLGTGTFKPEKNLFFFRIKSPGPHRCLPW